MQQQVPCVEVHADIKHIKDDFSDREPLRRFLNANVSIMNGYRVINTAEGATIILPEGKYVTLQQQVTVEVDDE